MEISWQVILETEININPFCQTNRIVYKYPDQATMMEFKCRLPHVNTVHVRAQGVSESQGKVSLNVTV